MFVTLQLQLLDDFRLRLHQLRKGEESNLLRSDGGKFIAIINATHHIAAMLAEWRELPVKYSQLFKIREVDVCILTYLLH